MESLSINKSPSAIDEQELKGPHPRSNYIDEEKGVIICKPRDAYQRTAWNKLQTSILILINKVNAVNVGTVTKELLKQNLVRGKHLFCQCITQVQLISTNDTHIYATLVAVINIVLPEIGELLLKRCVMQFKSAYFQNKEIECLSSVIFIGHLINHSVADEMLAVELLTFMFEQQTIFSMNIAFQILKTCGKKVMVSYKKETNEIFDKLQNFLNDEQLDEKVQNSIKEILELRETRFKFKQIDLVPAVEGQIIHSLTLDLVEDTPNIIDNHHYDPDHKINELNYKYQEHKTKSEDEYEDESGYGYDNDLNNKYDGEKKLVELIKQINYIETDTNIVSLRKMCLKNSINLMIDLIVDYNEFFQKILTIGQEIDLCLMVLDCCCAQRTYNNKFGLIAQEFCQKNSIFADMMEITFIHSYVTSYNYDKHKLQIVAKFFSHLLHTGSIPWKLLSIMDDDEPILYKRSYINILLQELSECIGYNNLNIHVKNAYLEKVFEAILLKNNSKLSIGYTKR